MQRCVWLPAFGSAWPMGCRQQVFSCLRATLKLALEMQMHALSLALQIQDANAFLHSQACWMQYSA